MENFHLKNNLLVIIERAQNLTASIWTPQINAEDVEIDVVNIVADELLKEMSLIDYDDIKKALVNMYFMGKILNNEAYGKKRKYEEN